MWNCFSTPIPKFYILMLLFNFAQGLIKFWLLPLKWTQIFARARGECVLKVFLKAQNLSDQKQICHKQNVSTCFNFKFSFCWLFFEEKGRYWQIFSKKTYSEHGSKFADFLELDKIYLIGSAGPVFENRKKCYITPPYYTGLGSFPWMHSILVTFSCQDDYCWKSNLSTENQSLVPLLTYLASNIIL